MCWWCNVIITLQWSKFVITHYPRVFDEITFSGDFSIAAPTPYMSHHHQCVSLLPIDTSSYCLVTLSHHNDSYYFRSISSRNRLQHPFSSLWHFWDDIGVELKPNNITLPIFFSDNITLQHFSCYYFSPQWLISKVPLLLKMWIMLNPSLTHLAHIIFITMSLLHSN